MNPYTVIVISYILPAEHGQLDCWHLYIMHQIHTVRLMGLKLDGVALFPKVGAGSKEHLGMIEIPAGPHR